MPAQRVASHALAVLVVLATLLVGVLPTGAALAATTARATGAALGDGGRSGLAPVLRGGGPAGSVARAAGSTRSASSADRFAADPLAGARTVAGAGPDGGPLAVLPSPPVVVVVQPHGQRPRPPSSALAAGLPAGPTGRSPPVPAAA